MKLLWAASLQVNGQGSAYGQRCHLKHTETYNSKPPGMAANPDVTLTSSRTIAAMKMHSTNQQYNLHMLNRKWQTKHSKHVSRAAPTSSPDSLFFSLSLSAA